MPKLAIQLYTVRDQVQKDFSGTVRALAGMGYAGIEHGGPGPLTPDRFNALMAELKLSPIGAHTGLQNLEGPKGADSLALYEAIGAKYLAVSLSAKTEEEWKRLGTSLNAAGRAARARGIIFQYHNHAHEFQKLGGKAALDVLLGESDPEVVKVQLDVGWVARAGEDPVGWMKKLGKRVATIHLKDTTAGPDPQWTEVGTGILPLAAVHAAARELGIEWYIVEQDTCARPTLESAEISLKNAKGTLGI